MNFLNREKNRSSRGRNEKEIAPDQEKISGEITGNSKLGKKKKTQSILEQSMAMAGRKISRKEELREIEIKDVPEIFFRDDMLAEKEAVEETLESLDFDGPDDPIVQHISLYDRLRRRVQQELAETIMQNYHLFVRGMQHVKSTEIDLAWALSYCSEARKNIHLLKDELVTPVMTIVRDYRTLIRLKQVIGIAQAAADFLKAERSLSVSIDSHDYINAVKNLDTCVNLLGKSPDFSRFKAVDEAKSRVMFFKTHLQSVLLQGLASLTILFDSVKLATIIQAMRELNKSLSEMDRDFGYDAEFRSTFMKSIEKMSLDAACSFLSVEFRESQLYEQFDENEDPLVVFTEVCHMIEADQMLPSASLIAKKLCSCMFAYDKICERLETNDQGRLPWILERLSAVAFSNKIMYWERVQEVMHILLATQNFSTASFEEVSTIHKLVNILILVGDRFANGPTTITEKDSTDNSFLQLDTHQNEGLKTSKSKLKSSASLILRQRLRVPLRQKCTEFFNSFRQNILENLRMDFQTEGWLSSTSEANILFQSKEFMELIDTQKSVFLDQDVFFQQFLKGDDIFSSQPDDSMISNENVSRRISSQISSEVDSIKQTIFNHRVQDTFCVVGISVKAFHYLCKYCLIIRDLNSIQSQALEAIEELLEFLIYSTFTLFGINVSYFFQKSNSKSSLTYPHLHKLLEQFKDKVSKGYFEISSCSPTNEAQSKNANNLPLLMILNEAVVSHLNSEKAMYGLIERISAVALIDIIQKTYRWATSRISKYIPEEKEYHLAQSVDDYERISKQFGDHIFRNLVPKVLNVRKISETSIPSINWKLSEISTSYSGYVDEFLEAFTIFAENLKSLQKISSLDSSSLKRLWEECLEYAFESLVDGYSLVRKCTPEGRALMSLDLRTIVSQLSSICPVDITTPVSFADDYIKAYYLPETDLIEWVVTHPKYKRTHCIALAQNGLIGAALKRRARDDFISKVESSYDQVHNVS